MTTEQIDIITTTQKIYCGREYEHNLTTNTQYNYIYVGEECVAGYIQNYGISIV